MRALPTPAAVFLRRLGRRSLGRRSVVVKGTVYGEPWLDEPLVQVALKYLRLDTGCRDRRSSRNRS